MKMMINEKNKPINKDLFLETSIPRKLLFGHSLVKEEIKKYLRGVRSWSSFYVLMEYKRSVVKTLIDLYFVTLEEDTPSDALNYFAEGFRQRETKIILSAIAEFLKEPDIANDKEKFLIKLETWIHSALVYFDTLIYEYVDNMTQCPLAKASINASFQNFLEEINCKTECTVERLWKSSKGHLKKLVKEAKEHNDKNEGFTKPLPLIESAISNPNTPKTKTKCMQAGDFVIALEMPRHLRMLTFDKAFERICGILGKEVLVLPSLVALKKMRVSVT